VASDEVSGKNEMTGSFHRGHREHRDEGKREISGKNEMTGSFRHPDRAGAGAGHRGHRDEQRRETNRRRETGERKETGERRDGTFVRRREQGETVVR
jgi:hypothetical protein